MGKLNGGFFNCFVLKAEADLYNDDIEKARSGVNTVAKLAKQVEEADLKTHKFNPQEW